MMKSRIYSLVKIREETGLSRECVLELMQKIVEESGQQKNEDMLSKDEIRNLQMLEKYKKGYSFYRIAQIYGLDKEYVKEIIHNLSESQQDVDNKANNSYKDSDENIKNKVIKIINEYSCTDRNLGIVKKYFEKQKASFKKSGEYDENKLELLKSSLEFIQGGLKDIVFVAKMFCLNGKYQDAIFVVEENKYNESFTDEEKEKISKIIEHIKFLMRKQKALEMLRSGNYSIYDVKCETELPKSIILEIVQKVKDEKRKNEEQGDGDGGKERFFSD